MDFFSHFSYLFIQFNYCLLTLHCNNYFLIASAKLLLWSQWSNKPWHEKQHPLIFKGAEFWMATSREVLLLWEGAEILQHLQVPAVSGAWHWMKQELFCINHHSSMNFHVNLSTSAISSPRFLINPGLPLQFQTCLTEVRSFGLVCKCDRCYVLEAILLEENISVRRYLAPNPHPGLHDH